MTSIDPTANQRLSVARLRDLLDRVPDQELEVWLPDHGRAGGYAPVTGFVVVEDPDPAPGEPTRFLALTSQPALPLVCPACGSDRLSSIERLLGVCAGIAVRSPDGRTAFEGFGTTDINYDSTRSIGVHRATPTILTRPGSCTCRACATQHQPHRHPLRPRPARSSTRSLRKPGVVLASFDSGLWVLVDQQRTIETAVDALETTGAHLRPVVLVDPHDPQHQAAVWNGHPAEEHAVLDLNDKEFTGRLHALAVGNPPS